jgi:hypothetical protein
MNGTEPPMANCPENISPEERTEQNIEREENVRIVLLVQVLTPKDIINDVRNFEFTGCVTSANDSIRLHRDRVSEMALPTSDYLYCMDTSLIVGWKH